MRKTPRDRAPRVALSAVPFDPAPGHPNFAEALSSAARFVACCRPDRDRPGSPLC
jgi:hypothetical protein